MDLSEQTIVSAISLEALQSLLHLAERAPDGAIAEVGVWKGGSAWFLSQLNRPLFLYDTFDGMPFQGPLDGNPVGKFADTSVEEVRKLVPSATIVQGIFPESLVPMPPLGFVHVDCDQYQSVRACIEVLGPKMVRGGMMLFDDFGVADCQGATRAVIESGLPYMQVAQTGKALIIF